MPWEDELLPGGAPFVAAAAAAPGVTTSAVSFAAPRPADETSMTFFPRPPPKVTREGASRRVTVARRLAVSSSSSLISSLSHLS